MPGALIELSAIAAVALADVLALAPDLFLEQRRAGVSVRAMNRTLHTLAAAIFA